MLRVWKGTLGVRCTWCLSTWIHRAVGVALESLPLGADARVYELSSKGALVAYLRKRFLRLTCSEYFDDVAPGSFRGGTQCQDVQCLTFEDAVFELVTSTEVFEHVPDDAKGFREIFRVLRPGGYFVLTVPLSGTDTTVERAVIRNGQVINLLPPEYHGDRIRGLGRVLAFRNYGTDIRSRLEATGFTVEILTITQPKNAIRDGRVIVCRKP